MLFMIRSRKELFDFEILKTESKTKLGRISTPN